MTLKIDFLEEDRGYPTRCWIWQGRISNAGYGETRRGGHFLAHRWSYERAKGPIPAGLVVDHLCDTRACINPEHLEPKSNADNVRRGKAKLTKQQVREIHASPLGCRKLSRQFGVARETILGIRAGRRWKDVAVDG